MRVLRTGIPAAGIAAGTAFVLERRVSAAPSAATGDPAAETARFHAALAQAKTELGATIFMVTHDSFAASFCDRVIVLKDGAIYGELRRQGDRRAFMDQLLDTIRTLSDDGRPAAMEPGLPCDSGERAEGAHGMFHTAALPAAYENDTRNIRNEDTRR